MGNWANIGISFAQDITLRNDHLMFSGITPSGNDGVSGTMLFSAMSAFASASNVEETADFSWLLVSKFNEVFTMWKGVNVSKENGIPGLLIFLGLCWTESILLIRLDDDLHSLAPLSSRTAVGKNNEQIMLCYSNKISCFTVLYHRFFDPQSVTAGCVNYKPVSQVPNEIGHKKMSVCNYLIILCLHGLHKDLVLKVAI